MGPNIVRQWKSVKEKRFFFKQSKMKTQTQGLTKLTSIGVTELKLSTHRFPSLKAST